jgi:ribonuclease HII
MTKRICGIDEAGRGPLAGPIVAAGIVIPESFDIQAIDSKKLTEKRREHWREEFQAHWAEYGIQFAIEEINVPDINAQGIGWANKELFRRLILKLEADLYLVDGNLKLGDFGPKAASVQNEVKGDEHIPVIAAASILAKTYRDQLMRELHEQYPQYHWAKNKGYGSPQHISAIKTFGGTLHHRQKYLETVTNKDYLRKSGQPFAQQLFLLTAGPSLLISALLGQFLQYPL